MSFSFSSLWKLSRVMSLIASFVATFLIHGGVGLKQVEILMPNFVPRGADVNFTCLYDMDISGVYAIKWYKGSQEFYRYVPKEVPPQQVFALHGVRVVLSKSDEHNVVLRDVPLEISGQFKCVVSAETTFQTLAASSYLTVVVIGHDKPVLELERTQYHPGDSVVGQCHTPASFPTANVSWYYNDKQIDRLMKTEVERAGDDPVAKVTVSTISFNLPGNVPADVIRIKCRATVYTIYDRYAVVPIQPVPRQLSDPHTLLRSASPGTFASKYFLLQQTIKVTCAQRLFFFVVQLLLHHRRLLPFPSSSFPSSSSLLSPSPTAAHRWPTFHC